MTAQPDLEALIARVEAASGPDREPDADIAMAVNAVPYDMEPAFMPGTWRGVYDDRHLDAPPYTASIDAAMTLVPEGMAFGCGRGTEEPEVEGWAWCGPDSGPYAFAATPALALVAAALRARKDEK